ncbi:MAG: hypothetical protein ACE3L7_04310 [Candidatus Pristimantibacillus sp.]
MKGKKTTAKRVVRTSMMKNKLIALLKKEGRVKASNTTGGNRSLIARSTGVINKSNTVVIAHTEILNRRSQSINVTVIVIDWDSGSPVVLSSTNRNISANSFSSFSTNVANVDFHYEVVVVLPTTNNVIVNNFGTTAGFVPQEGSTVLDRDLVTIRL